MFTPHYTCSLASLLAWLVAIHRHRRCTGLLLTSYSPTAIALLLESPLLVVACTSLSAGLLRQATYTTARLGVFTSLLEARTRDDGTAPPLWEKGIIGAIAGGVGAVVGTPAEVALIRMTGDGRLPAAERRNYRNAFDALLRITREVWCVYGVCFCCLDTTTVSSAMQETNHWHSWLK
jgi:hypothetical protein